MLVEAALLGLLAAGPAEEPSAAAENTLAQAFRAQCERRAATEFCQDFTAKTVAFFRQHHQPLEFNPRVVEPRPISPLTVTQGRILAADYRANTLARVALMRARYGNGAAPSCDGCDHLLNTCLTFVDNAYDACSAQVPDPGYCFFVYRDLLNVCFRDWSACMLRCTS
ncbi:MAG: hypothetical protein U0002_10820 [Thermoanaerobaculia bacterium]